MKSQEVSVFNFDHKGENTVIFSKGGACEAPIPIYWKG